MQPISTLFFAVLLTLGLTAPLAAQDSPATLPEEPSALPVEPPTEMPRASEPGHDDASEMVFVDAAEASLDEYLWVSRVLIVFADTERDPRFQEQLEELLADPEALLTRDLVVIVDSAPSAHSSVRTRLRPRGFMLAIVEKDGQVMSRKPSPRTVREISAIVDRFPMRRQEMLERRPAGR